MEGDKRKKVTQEKKKKVEPEKWVIDLQHCPPKSDTTLEARMRGRMYESDTRLEAYCRRVHNEWLEDLYDTYLPLIKFYLIVGLIIFICTIIRTVFIILGYYKGRN